MLGAVACEDIKVSHAGRGEHSVHRREGDRVRRSISALTSAGLAGGYLVNPRLAQVHWQPGDRQVPEAVPAVAGETPLFVDPAAIPSHQDVAMLGKALAARDGSYELMACFAAYTGLRWGELIALTAGQIDKAQRIVTVDSKVVEVRGHLFVEEPKNRKRRRTIYPRVTPAGWPLAEKIAARIAEVAIEQASGHNPLGLIFPTPAGKHWRSSNFNRRILQAAYLAIGWRNADGVSRWTWHSLRHVFCTSALNTWGMDVSDVSRLAGHANVRVTLEMYVGSVAGALDRARRATD